jgi:hypothetical protein
MAHVSESERDEKRRVEKGPDVFTNKTEHTSHCADPEGVMRSARCGVCGCAKCTTRPHTVHLLLALPTRLELAF